MSGRTGALDFDPPHFKLLREGHIREGLGSGFRVPHLPIVAIPSVVHDNILGVFNVRGLGGFNIGRGLGGLGFPR